MKPVTVASPCQLICVMDAERALCVGCGRTLQEIAGWSALDDSAKQRVVAALPARMQTMPALELPLPRRARVVP